MVGGESLLITTYPFFASILLSIAFTKWRIITLADRGFNLRMVRFHYLIPAHWL